MFHRYCSVPASVPPVYPYFLILNKEKEHWNGEMGLLHTHARARWGSLSRSVTVLPNAIRRRVYAAFCVERRVEQRWNGGTLRHKAVGRQITSHSRRRRDHHRGSVKRSAARAMRARSRL